MIAVIQVDGTERAMLDRMLASGELPVLTRLMSAGERVELSSPGTHFPAGAFQTLYTGASLGDHGLFYPWQWVAAEQRARPASALEAPPAIWERLARAGRRAIVLDPYESTPPELAPGPMVSGLQFAERTVLPSWSVPGGLRRRMRRRLGRPPDVTEVFGGKRLREQLRLRDRLLEANDRLAAAARQLLAGERPDLAWIAFSTAHIGGHQLLDASQLSAEGMTEGEAAEFGDALPSVLRSLDAAVGRVADALPDGSDLVLASVVGMEPSTSRADLLPGMLEAALSGGPLPSQEGGAIWQLRSKLPPGLRGSLSRALPARVALELTARLETSGHDWARTRAFAHPADNQGYVRLNLAGRERDGIVAPGASEDLCSEIEEGLRSFRDPDGSACVAAVDRTRELFSGAHSDRLPDLVVRWAQRPANAIDRVVSERFGEVIRAGAGSGRSGNHPERDCWAVLVPVAGRIRPLSRDPDLADVAATALELAGVPAGPAGEPLLER